MRISDWSSDVCSSDLLDLVAAGAALAAPRLDLFDLVAADHLHRDRLALRRLAAGGIAVRRLAGLAVRVLLGRRSGLGVGGFERRVRRRGRPPGIRGRSEEHTSELQSLMRISYAVFC